ncbi:MAG: hypothetical protein H6Q76_1505 [Firmicutes bacterium]|nr:hypothetical protein [Bacillota bacterium]
MGNGALATTEQKAGGIMDMSGSTVEMHHNLEEMKAKIDLVQQYIKEVMIPDIDYGKIPNTDKNTLFQPGADKLSFLYGYSRNIVSKEENKDFNTGHYDVTVRVQMRHKTSNIIVGDGEGSCSTRESKYCYRWVYDNDVPSGIDKSTLISQTFKTKKKEGEEQRSFTKYRMDNRDLFDTWNTILKMAIKRAYVAAVLASTGLGGMFSQDEDDFEAWAGGEDNNDRKDRLGKERLEKVQSFGLRRDDHHCPEKQNPIRRGEKERQGRRY